MNTKEKNTKNKVNSLKANKKLLIVGLLTVVIIIVFVITLFTCKFSNMDSNAPENNLNNENLANLFSIDKIVCYSNSYATENSDTQARWNLNLSQFTDIEIYYNLKQDVSSMYIDNISFNNNDIGTLSLNYLHPNNFGKSPLSLEIEDKTNNATNDISNFSVENVLNINNMSSDIANSNTTNTDNAKRIGLNLTNPITLRYLNENFKENCIITNIDTPLTFDGSILKRSKVTASSLKNIVNFNLHVVYTSGQEFDYAVSIPINLENKETGQSIYDGYYIEEIPSI